MKAISREDLIKKLREKVNNHKSILGCGAGTGITAKMVDGIADLIIIYNSGRFRMAGCGSLAGQLPYGDANTIVLEMANEILPQTTKTPVVAGVCGTDPMRNMNVFLQQLKSIGIAGIQNYPTVGLYDGVFRQNLEETGMGYSLEVEMISKASQLGFLTCPYVFDEKQAEDMATAGADIIVAHMGLTAKGTIGARSTITLEQASKKIESIANAALKVNPKILITCHGGPIATPDDMKYIFENVKNIHGFWGASSIERLAVEKAIPELASQFSNLQMHKDLEFTHTPLNYFKAKL